MRTKKMEGCANGVNILRGRTESLFLCVCSSVMSNPNGTKFITEVPSSQGRLHFKFEENSFSHSRDTRDQTCKKNSCSSFCTLWKNHYNSHILAENWNTYYESKGKYQYQIWVYLIKIQRVTSYSTHKAKENFCHAYI